MNALLLATMVFGAAATESQAGVEEGVEFKMTTEVDEATLRKTAEFIQIEHTMNDIADRITAVKLKETDFKFGEFDWIDNDGSTSGEMDNEASSMLETEKVEVDTGLEKRTSQKRSCKTFEDTHFTINAKDKTAVVIGNTWESCLKSCEENLLCAQVVFDKKAKKCLGYRMANSKTMTGIVPENFMSGHCETSEETVAVNLLKKANTEPVEDTSILQTEDKSEVANSVEAEFEEQMKMEEQLAIEERMEKEKATPQQAAKFWNQKKATAQPAIAKPDNYWSKKSSLKLRQKITKKCTTFETENLVKKGSLLQMGKKLLQSETTGDFLTCLQKCQKDATCKQVVYDKQASQCYKHDEIAVQKTNAKGTKYIAATCQ